MVYLNLLVINKVETVLIKELGIVVVSFFFLFFYKYITLYFTIAGLVLLVLAMQSSLVQVFLGMES
jgi:hypothetical protein